MIPEAFCFPSMSLFSLPGIIYSLLFPSSTAEILFWFPALWFCFHMRNTSLKILQEYLPPFFLSPFSHQLNESCKTFSILPSQGKVEASYALTSPEILNWYIMYCFVFWIKNILWLLAISTSQSNKRSNNTGTSTKE